METEKHEIREAVQTLGLGAAEFKELSDEEAKPIFLRALNRFVEGDDRRWWWEAFNQPSVSRQLENGWTLLPKLVPDPRSAVWFIAEETLLPFYPVYEATLEAITAVIGECYGFEYYLIAKDMSWLICENHHNMLIAVGEPVSSRLAKMIEE